MWRFDPVRASRRAGRTSPVAAAGRWYLLPQLLSPNTMN
jgi:hypothetical protein